MLISLMFLGLVAVMQAFPDTAVGRGLRRWMVDGPAGWFNRLTPRTVVVAILTLAAVMILAQTLPVGMATAMAGDLAAYMEITVALTAVAAGASVRRLLAAVRDRVAQTVVTVRQSLARPRARTAERRPRRLPPPDAEGRPAFA